MGLTAKELTTIDTPFYLFRFYNIQKNENYLIYLSKLNATSERYDLFSIDLPNDLDLPTGNYLYTIYQSVDDVNFHYKDMPILEEGRVEVVKEFPSTPSFVYTKIDQINYVV